MNILEKTLRKVILEAFLVAMFTTMANKIVEHIEDKIVKKKEEDKKKD